MTLFWSVRPFEQVMAASQESLQLEEIRLQDVTVLVSNFGENVRIERLISPNPNDYLNTSWQPGTVVARRDL
jgi:hypothetical protein